MKDKKWHELQQFIGLQIGEDWRDEYGDPWVAAEDWIQTTRDERLRSLRDNISLLFDDYPERLQRFHFMELYGAFPNEDAFDAWLLAVQTRIEQALAGIHTQPLVDPDSHRPGDG